MLAAAFGFVLVKVLQARKTENMGGYGILSGLYFNNNARRRFKNPYDPDSFNGYEETIGKVII